MNAEPMQGIFISHGTLHLVLQSAYWTDTLLLLTPAPGGNPPSVLA